MLQKILYTVFRSHAIMWPISSISKALDNRKLKRSCLDEILNVIRAIPEDDTAYKHQADRIRNSDVALLIDLRKEGMPYSIDVVMVRQGIKYNSFDGEFSSTAHEIIPNIPGHYRWIGNIKNEFYKFEKKDFESKLAEFEEQGLVPRLPSEESVKKSVQEEHLKKVQEWEKQWEEDYKIHHGKCYDCRGEGNIVNSKWHPNIGGEISPNTCPSCGGSGTLTPEEYKYRYQPLKPKSGEEVLQGLMRERERIIAKLQTEKCPLVPLPVASLYLRISPA
jgi:hypothetical protein